MTLKLRFIGAMVLFGLIALAVYASLQTNLVKAAVAEFYPATCYTALATTSPVYFTALGTGTTTVSCSLGGNGARSAVLSAEINASSTAQFAFTAEESMDGVDWFPISIATSSTPQAIQNSMVYNYTFASSTIGGVAASTGLLGLNGTNNRNHFSIDIPVRMKRVRVNAGLTSATLGALWLQIVPREDIN